jgi:hypothetical protein
VRIILKCLKESGWEIMNWIHLAQYRNSCWAVVHTVMKP